jgi:hypothetical protein
MPDRVAGVAIAALRTAAAILLLVVLYDDIGKSEWCRTALVAFE